MLRAGTLSASDWVELGRSESSRHAQGSRTSPTTAARECELPES